MVVRVSGGIITDQMLTGSLRYFDINDTGLGTDVIGDAGRIVEATIVDEGSSYANGNVLTVSGGTSSTPATLTILGAGAGPGGADGVDGSGGVVYFSISEPGVYSVLPANPVSVTGGAGSAATFNLVWGSTIIVPGASPQVGIETYVGYNAPVPSSAADLALAEVAKYATIVQTAIVSANVIRIACANNGFAWDRPGGGDAAADMATAIVALGSVTVPNNTNTGATFNFTGATVTERFFETFT